MESLEHRVPSEMKMKFTWIVPEFGTTKEWKKACKSSTIEIVNSGILQDQCTECVCVPSRWKFCYAKMFLFFGPPLFIPCRLFILIERLLIRLISIQNQCVFQWCVIFVCSRVCTHTQNQSIMISRLLKIYSPYECYSPL